MNAETAWITMWMTSLDDMESHISDLRHVLSRILLCPKYSKPSRVWVHQWRNLPCWRETQTLLYRLTDTDHHERGPILFGTGQLLSAVHTQFADIAAHSTTSPQTRRPWCGNKSTRRPLRHSRMPWFCPPSLTTQSRGQVHPNHWRIRQWSWGSPIHQ